MYKYNKVPKKIYLDLVEENTDVKKPSEDTPETKTKTLKLERKCRYHECYHDEDPPKPCGDYKYVGFDDAEKTWAEKD